MRVIHTWKTHSGDRWADILGREDAIVFLKKKSATALGRMAGPRWDLGAGVLGLLSKKLSGLRGGVLGPLMFTSEDEADRDTRAISANPPKGRLPG